VNRGEIWWVDLPDVERRPHLVLSRQTAIPVLNAYITVPATRTIRDIPTEVRLGSVDGIRGDGVLSLDKVATVPRSFFTDRITRLGADRLAQVCSALGIATGCA